MSLRRSEASGSATALRGSVLALGIAYDSACLQEATAGSTNTLWRPKRAMPTGTFLRCGSGAQAAVEAAAPDSDGGLCPAVLCVDSLPEAPECGLVDSHGCFIIISAVLPARRL